MVANFLNVSLWMCIRLLVGKWLICAKCYAFSMKHSDSLICNFQVTSFEPYMSLRRTVRWTPCVSRHQSLLTTKPTFACAASCYSARLSTLSGQFWPVCTPYNIYRCLFCRCIYWCQVGSKTFCLKSILSMSVIWIWVIGISESHLSQFPHFWNELFWNWAKVSTCFVIKSLTHTFSIVSRGISQLKEKKM